MSYSPYPVIDHAAVVFDEECFAIKHKTNSYFVSILLWEKYDRTILS